MLPNGSAILFPFFRRSLASGAFDSGGFLKANGQGPRAHLGVTVQRHQQRSLQKAQSQHEIDMKGRRQWIALVKGLLNHSSRFMQTRVVDGNPDVASPTQRERLFENRRKQLLRLPLTSRVKKVFGAPAAVLPAIGPDDPGHGAPAQADQRAERLTNGSFEGTSLRKNTFPLLNDSQERRQQGHLFLLAQCESISLGAHETIATRNLLGKRGNQTVAINANSKSGVDSIQQIRDMERRPAFLSTSYAMSTCDRRDLRDGLLSDYFALAQSANGAQVGRLMMLQLWIELYLSYHRPWQAPMELVQR